MMSWAMSSTLKNVVMPMCAVLLALLFAGCSSVATEQRAADSVSNAFSEDRMNAAIMGKWARSCALCHVDGEAGAPVIGDTAAWQRRLAQGEDSILRRVIEGYNSMPPLGYCMACEVQDFRAMIAYMAGTSQ